MQSRIGLLLAMVLLLAACASQQTAGVPTAAPAPADPAGGERAVLTVMTHDSFAVSAETIAAFEQTNNASVRLLPSGDAGAVLNKAILAKGSPQADVLFGVDNTFLSRALQADIFEPYASPLLDTVPQQFKLDKSNRLLPINYGYVALNYDKTYLAENNLTAPTSLRDLTEPAWKSKLVVENPATSSPGLAFLLASVAEFGESGDYTYLDFWRDLRANDVLVSEGWDDAYNRQFSGSSGNGPRPLVVSYASSPPAEVLFSETPITEAPTGIVQDGSFLQIEFAGILQGTQNRTLAEKFIDFMLSPTFQEDVPLQMFVYPVQPDAAVPEAFTKYAELPTETATLPPEQIEQQREAWIEAWTQTVLR